jgi:signal peptidase
MRFVRFTSRVVIWLVLLASVAAVVVAVAIPRIAGATPYTVLTGSMQPDYPPGTLVVVKPIAADEISVGDVITYQLESGKPTVVTHRVVSVGTRLDGEIVFITQGDANGAPDPEPVRAVQVQGKLWYSAPLLGRANTALNGRQRQTAVLVVSVLLVGYAAFMFVGSVRDRRRRKRAPEIPTAPVIRETAPRPPWAAIEQRSAGGPSVRIMALGGAAALLAIGLFVRKRRRSSAE